MMETVTSKDFIREDEDGQVKAQVETLLNGKHVAESSFTNINWKTEPQTISETEHDTKAKKKVNICTEYSGNEDERCCSETSESCDRSAASIISDKCLTMTGTIKRGKKAGQSLDVRLNISREELELMEANIAAKEQSRKQMCSLRNGLHILLFTLICFPFVLVISSLYSFYIGTLTWYNVFTYVTEEKSIMYKICLSPLLILVYPLLIAVFTIGLGFYAAYAQVSWFLSEWQREICDWEKGFYGWFCSLINLEECSPYEVVILTDIKESGDQAKNNSQDSILT